jgi:hypothetical protein
MEAFNLLDEMAALKVTPGLIMFTNLIHISFKCERPDMADKAFQMMTNKGVKGDHICFSKLVTGFQAVKLYKKAYNYVIKAFSADSYVRSEVLVRLRGSLGNTNTKKYKEEVETINWYISEAKKLEQTQKDTTTHSNNYKGKNFNTQHKKFSEKRARTNVDFDHTKLSTKPKVIYSKENYGENVNQIKKNGEKDKNGFSKPLNDVKICLHR